MTGPGMSEPYAETLLGKMNCRTGVAEFRLASVMASITRAVPATLICHIRSKSRTPERWGSITNARCTTDAGCTSRKSRYSSRVEASFPRSIATKRWVWAVAGGATSTPTTVY